MNKENQKEIKAQKSDVFENSFKVDLIDSCTIENGIISLSEYEKTQAELTYLELNEYPSFFIPASGSGSRMFKFLFEWLKDEIDTEDVQSFFNNAEKLPFFSSLVTNIIDKEDFVNEVLQKFSELPKGLIPFFNSDGASQTSFQAQIRQSKQLAGEKVKIHFTVQQSFLTKIEENISEKLANISFSFQDELTNSFCFHENQELVIENGDELRRPAGHGALLNNLNAVQGDLILMKNIDNIQDESSSLATISAWKQTIGVLILFKKDLKKLMDNFTTKGLVEINDKYQFLSKEEEANFSSEDLKLICNRPTRVCGMVTNEGEPGGGPFWIKDSNGITKQIIEKAQFKEDENQSEIVKRSSHFNPVFIALSKTNIHDEPLDLMSFRDDSKFFIVNKSHKGKEILYRELPGLWNGSMSNWNTLFLKVSSNVFTPVKSVLDLI